MPGLTPYPPFPQDVSTSPLFVIDYELIKAGDADEIERLWKAATEMGFWHLTNHEEEEGMFAMGEEATALTLERSCFLGRETTAFRLGTFSRISRIYTLHQPPHRHSYKAAGVLFTDNKGTRDVTEFVNISRNDALAWLAVARGRYPSSANAWMESTITPFVKNLSLAIDNRLIGVLNDKLRPCGHAHKAEEAPPCAGPNFESMSFLHNRLGGLQVLPPGSDQWFYIKPLSGHATCNIGDALNIFSGGILRFNIHRVVPSTNATLSSSSPPNDIVELRTLSEQNERIAAAVANAPLGKYTPSVMAMEWLVRRVKAAGDKLQDSWTDRQGTEDTAIPSQGKI
ncbi:Clavaminate synthase-like protein [Epithele typhae]|uniref:Clavaminate synthase-like protein n=1 Tax=Epithele typhae TaxID=378194 RepID=UPI0020089DF4|nr:Clavaminate synthase-like protein [Epithele typhae]KAH9936761.1 Clavaminate synthase-like protein [Epithele typhae]